MSEQNEELERLTQESGVPARGTRDGRGASGPGDGKHGAHGVGRGRHHVVPAGKREQPDSGAFSARLQVRPEDEAAAREVLASAVEAPETMEDVTAAESASEPEER